MTRANSSVLFLLPYPLQQAPSQRFRVELFLDHLDAEGITYRLEPFWDRVTGNALYQPGKWWQKGVGLFRGFIRRLYAVFFVAPRYSHVFIHREAAPLGPPFFEWLLAKLLRKKLVYDFDDAIWIPNTTAVNGIASLLKASWKVKHIARWSYRVAVGNAYLKLWASRFNNQVTLLPTCVDAIQGHNRVKTHCSEVVTIGWTGSHSTLSYLDPLVPLLQRLLATYNTAGRQAVRLLIIANRPPDFKIDGMVFLPWRAASEVDDLLQFDIGLMPLQQDAWSEGKCGFKLIQYLALGIPAVASPVGVNKDIVEPGVNGFLCNSIDDWQYALEQLIENAALRKQMGEAGRSKVHSLYSKQAHAANFTALFD